MDAEAVVDVCSALRSAGVRAWLAGGWAVDALAGRQTREHDDADIAIDTRDIQVAVAVLAEAGFVETHDERPFRFVLSNADCQAVDVHPVAFGPDGVGRQGFPEGVHYAYPPGDLLAEGVIAGHPVACLSHRLIAEFHRGYHPTWKDTHNLAVLDEIRATKE
jgi:lincosamide nucleotidyltransferase A/C/D/E